MPRWRFGLYCGLLGIGATLALEALALGESWLVPPQPPEVKLEVHTHERVKQQTKKRRNTESFSSATPVFVKDELGRIKLGGYRFESVLRERALEEVETDTAKSVDLKRTESQAQSYFRIGVGVGYGKPLLEVPGAKGLLIGGEFDVRLPLDKLPSPIRPPSNVGVSVGVRGGNYGGMAAISGHF